MQSRTKDPPQSIKLGAGIEMKTIAEEPVQHTGECCCCRNSNINHATPTSSNCIYPNCHCHPGHGRNDGTNICHHGTNNNNTPNQQDQCFGVPDNQQSLVTTGNSVLTHSGDIINTSCGECNSARGVTATITTRKKVNNNHLNDNSRRQR